MRTVAEKEIQTLNRKINNEDLSGRVIILNKEKFVQILDEINNTNNFDTLKNHIVLLRDIVTNFKNDYEGLLNIDTNGDTVVLKRDVLSSELNQIWTAHTIERAKYYLRRLEISIKRIKTGKINDINLNRWKEYNEIITDSLWVLDKRVRVCLLN